MISKKYTKFLRRSVVFEFEKNNLNLLRFQRNMKKLCMIYNVLEVVLKDFASHLNMTILSDLNLKYWITFLMLAHFYENKNICEILRKHFG